MGPAVGSADLNYRAATIDELHRLLIEFSCDARREHLFVIAAHSASDRNLINAHTTMLSDAAEQNYTSQVMPCLKYDVSSDTL